MKKNRIYTVAIIFWVGIISCNSSKSNENEAVQTAETSSIIEVSAEQFKSAQMELQPIAPQQFFESVKTNGFIDVPPTDRAMVSATMGGFVKISHLLIGEQVKKGQLLLTLENPDFIEIQQKCYLSRKCSKNNWVSVV